MEAEPELDFAALLRELNRRGIRFVVIGGQAVILHDIPIDTFDYDLWIDPAARREVLTLLGETPDFELSAGPDDLIPIVTAYVGPERMDLFFVRAMTNREKVTIEFEELLARAEVLSDAATGLERIAIPSIDDLIALKRMPSTPRAKDEEAIKYLLAKQLLRGGAV